MSALQQAARAVLARWDSPQWDWKAEGPTADLMHALRAALDAGQMQPVAWYYVEDPWGANEWHWMTDSPESQGCDPRDWTPVYASPPARQPLTDEQIAAAIGFNKDASPQAIVYYSIARAIERAHGIT